MRFREEVLAKIFTYITVAVLLGIVAFEAAERMQRTMQQYFRKK